MADKAHNVERRYRALLMKAAAIVAASLVDAGERSLIRHLTAIGNVMGYEIHITRKKHWLDEDGPSISLGDWKAYVASHSDMRLDGYAETTLGHGDILRVEDEGIAVWTAYSGHGVNGNMAWLCHGSGEITAKNPDEEILRKMFEIAEALGARVVGDEGEEYGADGQVVASEDIDQPSEVPDIKAPKRPWWKVF